MPTIDLDRAIEFLDFVVERHRIWEQRQAGTPGPWTADPVLATKKFTNVFRVLDPGSQFVFDLETDDPVDTLTRLFLYRFTNLPDTWRYIHAAIGRYPLAEDMNPDLSLLINCIPGRKFSGAYLILPQPNRPGDKVEQAVNLAAEFRDDYLPAVLAAPSLAEQFDVMTKQYGVGDFMAYQILTDWGYTRHVERNRENDFVVAGPGAQKGAAALVGVPHTAKRNWVVQSVAQDVIHWARNALLSDPRCPSLAGVQPSLQSVQNCFCEYSKYVRGPRSTTYSPQHPGPQSEPQLPRWWGLH